MDWHHGFVTQEQIEAEAELVQLRAEVAALRAAWCELQDLAEIEFRQQKHSQLSEAIGLHCIRHGGPKLIYQAIVNIGRRHNVKLHRIGWEAAVAAIDKDISEQQAAKAKNRGAQLQKAPPDDQVMALWRCAFDQHKGKRNAKSLADEDVAKLIGVQPSTVQRIRLRSVTHPGCAM